MADSRAVGSRVRVSSFEQKYQLIQPFLSGHLKAEEHPIETYSDDDALCCCIELIAWGSAPLIKAFLQGILGRPWRFVDVACSMSSFWSSYSLLLGCRQKFMACLTSSFVLLHSPYCLVIVSQQRTCACCTAPPASNKTEAKSLIACALAATSSAQIDSHRCLIANPRISSSWTRCDGDEFLLSKFSMGLAHKLSKLSASADGFFLLGRLIAGLISPF